MQYRQLIFLPFTWTARNISYRLRVVGHGHIPENGGALLICNHVSYVDWLMIASGVRRPVRFVIDHSYFRGVLIRPILSLAGVIPIAGGREDPARLGQAYEGIADALRAGELVCIFPEGRLTLDGRLGPFKPGVIKILKRSPVPVIPMAINGLWGSFFSRQGGAVFRRWPKRLGHPVELRIGPAISPAEAKLSLLEKRVRDLCASAEKG